MPRDELPPTIYLRPRPSVAPPSPAEAARRAKAVARTLAWRARNEANGLPRTGYRPSIPHHARALTARQALVLGAFQRAYARANLLHDPDPRAPRLPGSTVVDVTIGAIEQHLPTPLRRDLLMTALRQLHKRKWLVHRALIVPGYLQRQHRFGWFDRSTLADL